MSATEFTQHKRIKRMHIIIAGPDPSDGSKNIGVFKCRICGTETEWIECGTITEMKRGIPCEKCNK